MPCDDSGLTLRAFRTLAKQAEGETVIKKSRFIGCASPAQDEEAALSFLRRVRDAHPLASHHCYAYVLGANAAATRFSDNGEPSGTAGKPILEVLTRQQLTNACVVVVRYFGGTLLGRGGLVRAYAGACALAVAQSGVATEEPSVRVQAVVPYPLWDRVQFALRALPVQPGEPSYTDQVVLTLLMRANDYDGVQALLTDVSEGRIGLTIVERLYAKWPQSQST